MKRKKLLVLFSITIVVIIMATLIAQSRAPQSRIEKEYLFPGLVDKINNVSHIEIKSGDDRNVVLQQEENQWSVVTADNYPANIDIIKNTVLSLAELKILATKTDNSALYPELGVEDPGNKSSSMLLTLSDESGATMASLIVGKPRKNSAGNTRPNLYVRKPGIKNALLVEGYLQLKPNNYDWYERNVINIPVSRVREITILKENGNLLRVNKDSKGDTDFKTIEGNSNAPAVLINKLGTFLEDMNVEGVYAADNFEFPEDSTTTTFKTFNGLVITVKSSLKEDKAFAHFSFTTTEPMNESTEPVSETESQTINVDEESRILNDFLGNWVYVIPEFKFETLNIHVGQPSK